MENELQRNIVNLQVEITEVNTEIDKYSQDFSKLNEKIDLECQVLCKKYQNENIKWENLQFVNLIDNRGYIAKFCYDDSKVVDIIEVVAEKSFFDIFGEYLEITYKRSALVTKLVKLEKELERLELEQQKIFDDQDKTIFALDKELKELQVINDNVIFKYGLMNANNSLPRVMTLLDEQGNKEPRQQLSVKNGVVDIKIGKKYYVLDLCDVDFAKNTSFYDEIFKNIGTFKAFSSNKRKQFVRFVLLFAGESVKTDNLSDEQLYNKSREYALENFNTNVRKIWDYVNNKLLERCKDISVKDDGSFRDILNSQVIRLSFKEVAKVLGLEYTKNTDFKVRQRIKQDVTFLANMRLQCIKWAEVSDNKRKEVTKQLKNKTYSYEKAELEKTFKSGFHIANTENSAKIEVNGFINVFESFFKGENEKGNGFFRVEFGRSYVNFLIRQNTFKLPATLFEIDGRNKNAYNLGKALVHMMYTKNNLSSKDNQPLTELVYKDNFPLVDTLLQYTCIPNVEQCKNLETRKSYKELIINPFIKALETLQEMCGLSFEFRKKDNKVELEKVKKMKVQEFLKLQLNYKFEPLEKE